MKRQEINGRECIWSVLEPHWRSLLEETQDPSPFLSAEWIESWLSIRQEQLGTRALLWRDERGSVVGCALASIQGGRIGWFAVRQAFLNASGGMEVASEHNDFLAVERYRRAIMEDLIQWQLAEESIDEFAVVGGRRRLTDLVSSIWPSRRVDGYSSEAPYVELDAVRSSGGDYLALLSSNTRGQIRRSIRLYRDRLGPPHLEFAMGEQERLEWLEELIELHEEHWQARGKRGGFSDGRREFHRSLIGVASDRPCDGLEVCLCRLRFGEHLIGMLYLLVFRDRVYFYQSGFRYDDDNRLKPGLVTHALTIQHFADQGYAEYDLLGGEPEPVQYKRSLSTGVRTLEWIRLAAPSVKMRLITTIRALGRRMVKKDAPAFGHYPHRTSSPRGPA